MGAIAAEIGGAQRLEENAQADHQAGKVSCIHGLLESLRSLESQAHEQRSAMRAADDEDAASGPFSALSSLDATARSLRTSASQCNEPVQAEAYSVQRSYRTDNDSDGIVDTVDIATPATGGPASDGRFRELESSVSKAKAGVSRTVALLGTPGPTTTTPQSPSSTQAASSSAQRQAMLIRTADISLAVYEVDKNLNAVEKAANDLGGYLALRSDRQITVRVPAEKFDELVAKIERMGDVLHKNIAAEDVSDQFVDVDMRLKNATAVRDRLEKLLVGATVKDAVEIHRELAKVTEEIERLEGKLKLLKDRIAYSSISVSFEPTQAQSVRSQALLPFAWMTTMGLQPLLTVPRESK